jgi:uncharacterized protein YegL
MASYGVPTRPLDIVLLVDASQSMEGEPLQQSVMAVEAFLEQIDLTMHNVALLLFSGLIEEAQPLTNDLTRLQALLRRASAQDGTAIDVALHAGREELRSSRRRPGTSALIILLSDGGSDPATALEEARLASEDGIPIVVVGFKGTDFNEALLRQLATSGFYRLAQVPEDLATLFQDLADQLNRLIATDVRIREPVNPVFEVVQESIMPQATILQQDVEWHLAWLTGEGTSPEERMKLSYRARISHWGLHQVVNEPGEIRWRDYSGMFNRRITPKGPYVLVLPPLPLVLAPLLFLALPGLMLLTWPWFRRRKKRVEPAPEEEMEIQPPPVPLPSPEKAFHEWLSRAKSLQPEWADPTRLRERPAFFIGLGYAGEKVLTHLANYLRARWGEPWPSRVQLLHIDVTEEEEEAPPTTGLPSVRLYIDKRRREKLPFGRHIGLDWFNPRYIGKPGRALGRLALFADLIEGKFQSRLWRTLEAELGDLKDISVYIIADAFSDEASGMIADVAHLVRELGQGQVTMVTLCLAAQHARWPDELSDMRRNERTFATLRELQRLQRKTPVRFPYAPGLGQPELDATSEVPLFDELVIFDGWGEETPDGYRHDISQWRAEDALLATMAECMIALLDPQISHKFYEHWTEQASLSVRLGKVPSEKVAGAMGSYTIRFPIEEMRRVLEARLVHRLLFDREMGLIGWEELDEEGQPRRRGDLDFTIPSTVEIESFLNMLGVTPSTVHRLKWDSFRRSLLDYLEEQLNQRPGLRLRWAEKFVAELRRMLPDWTEDLREIEDALQAWISATGEESKRIREDFLASFLGLEAEASETEVELEPGPLYIAWEAEWKRAREQMERVTEMPSYRALWNLSDEVELFNQFIAKAPDKPLERMRGRVRWRWIERGGKLKLALLILPLKLDKPLKERIRQSPALIAKTADEPEEVIKSLMSMARYFSRLTKATLWTFLDREDTSQLAIELERKATPLYRQRRKGLIQIRSFRYLAGPGLSEEHNLAKEILSLMQARRDVTAPGTFDFCVVSTEDPTECRLLHVKYTLPLHNMEAYVEAKEKYNPRPELHVFEEEQKATQWEKKARRKIPRGLALAFSPFFVEQIAQHGEELHLFGQCIVYGLLKIQPEALRITASEPMLEICRDLSEAPFNRAFKRFLECLKNEPDCVRRLKSALSQHKPQGYSQLVEILDQVRDKVIRPLSEREEAEAQDLALLLAKVIVDEEWEAS